MKITKIPSGLPFRKLVQLSPSRFTSLNRGCVYSYVLSSQFSQLDDRDRYILPSASFNSRIGSIAHSVFEMVAAGSLHPTAEAIIEFWELATAQIEDEIKALYPTLQNVSVCDYDALYRTIDAAIDAAPMTGVTGGESFNTTECFVEIPNLLRGKIDRLRRVASNAYEIIDYKTGQVYEDGQDGQIKQEYIDQLHLYAFMAEEFLGIEVAGIFIIDKYGIELPIVFDRSTRNQYMADVQRIIDAISHAIDAGDYSQITTPSADNCRFCQCRHLCQSRIVNNTDDYADIIDGNVTEVRNTDQIRLRLNSGEEAIISKLSALEIEDWESLQGRHLLLTSLRRIGDYAFARTEKTIIFEL